MAKGMWCLSTDELFYVAPAMGYTWKEWPEWVYFEYAPQRARLYAIFLDDVQIGNATGQTELRTKIVTHLVKRMERTE